MNVTPCDCDDLERAVGIPPRHQDAAERDRARQRDAVQQAADVRGTARASGRSRPGRVRAPPPSPSPCTRASPACAARPWARRSNPEVHSTAASCSGSDQRSVDGIAESAARRGRARPAAGPPSIARVDLVGAGLMMQRRRDRAEAPARAVREHDLGTVRRLPRDHVARLDARGAQPAGDTGNRGAQRAGGRVGEQRVERRAVPRATRPPVLGRADAARTSASSTVQVRWRFQPSLAGVAPRSTLVPTKLRWISTVPAPMHSPRMSRYTRSTGYSRLKP